MSVATALTPTFPLDPADAAWGSPLWPAWVKNFRLHQVDAVMEVIQHFDDGADVVLLNAPTGSGKTIIAEAVRRLMRVPKCLYVANTKGLQDQFMQDFGDYARCLKGRSNYPTLNFPERFDAPIFRRLSCGDCNKHSVEGEFECSMCDPVWLCPYEKAKTVALAAPLAITNTAYFIAEANGPGRLVKAGRQYKPIPLVIVDECDTLESILMGQVEVVITKKWLKKLGLTPPDKKTVKESWLRWFDDEAIPKLLKVVKKWERQQELIRENVREGFTVDEIRERNHVNGLYDRVVQLRQQLLLDNVVYDGYGDGEVRFKAIHVNAFGPDRVWRHGNKWLLMSATIIDPTEFADSLGLTDAGLRWEVVNVPSTFPPENRPVHIKPVANMIYKEKETAWPEMVKGVERVLAKHPGERTLVHTVSYDFTKYCIEHLKNTGRTILSYAMAKEREETLEKFRTTEGAVLLAPSMDRGVDLPEDDCRVVVVTKMPFLSLGDKQVSARLYSRGGQLWYAVSTIRSLVQMTGRGVRSESDRCHIYVLDKQFLKIFKDNKQLLPQWWIDAIDWSGGGL